MFTKVHEGHIERFHIGHRWFSKFFRYASQIIGTPEKSVQQDQRFGTLRAEAAIVKWNGHQKMWKLKE